MGKNHSISDLLKGPAVKMVVRWLQAAARNTDANAIVSCLRAHVRRHVSG